MLLKWTNDKIMITAVVSIPITVVEPMTTRLTSSRGRLYIIQELHFGLHSSSLVGSAKKSFGQTRLVLSSAP